MEDLAGRGIGGAKGGAWRLLVMDVELGLEVELG